MSSKRASNIDGLVAKRVRAQRVRLGLSQTELADRLGITFQQIQKYEKGVNRIGAGRLFEMSRIFNIPIEVLFPGSDEAVEAAAHQSREVSNVPDLMATAGGRRLSRAFLQIEDAELRSRIIALIEGIAR